MIGRKKNQPSHEEVSQAAEQEHKPLAKATRTHCATCDGSGLHGGGLCQDCNGHGYTQ
jgi:DnaJ-class molecular chaperone